MIEFISGVLTYAITLIIIGITIIPIFIISLFTLGIIEKIYERFFGD